MKIVAGAIARDEQQFISTMIQSLSWVDELVIVSDHSQDNTESIVTSCAKKTNHPYITLIRSPFDFPMITYLESGQRDISREIEVRNWFQNHLFQNFSPDALILIDGDEVMSSLLKPQIANSSQRKQHDGIALTCNHLFDLQLYLHVYEGTWNSVHMVDPHVRVLFEPMPYRPGEWVDVPDPFIKHTPRTACLDGPYHYHLRYCKNVGLRNYAFKHLPVGLNTENAAAALHPHRYPIPSDILPLIQPFTS